MDNPFPRQIVQTEDGSSSIFVPELGEHYHSIHGALQESLHVFIREGLHRLPDHWSEIRILEVGFGTGLNALLALAHLPEGVKLYYHALEPYPLEVQEAKALSFPFGDGLPDRDTFLSLHHAAWEKDVEIVPGFVLHKSRAPLHQAHFSHGGYHLVFYDAFGPQVQPSMWTGDLLKRVSDHMVPGGLLLTYCAKGSVKRAMRQCGLILQHPRGAYGKREMTRALKPQASEGGRVILRVYGIAIHNDRLLVCDEFWFNTLMTKFPGGGLEYGEGIIDCLKRECREEFGQEIHSLSHFFTTETFQETRFRPGHQLVSIYYRMQLEDPDAIDAKDVPFDFPRLREGAMAFRWILLDELHPDMFILPLDKKVVCMLLESVQQ